MTRLLSLAMLTSVVALADPAAAAPACNQAYTVRAGDTLSSIARTAYGDVKRWRAIYQFGNNEDAIGSSPSRIRPGTVLTLPPCPTPEQDLVTPVAANDLKPQPSNVIAASNTSDDRGGPLVPIDARIKSSIEAEISGPDDALLSPPENRPIPVKSVDIALAVDDEPEADTAITPALTSLRLTASAEEGGEAAERLRFKLTLSEPPEGSVLVIYSLINGTAVAPGDYTHQQGTIVFEPGQTEAEVITDIVNDDVSEGDESFSFFITADPAIVTIEERKVAAIIADDDG